jgi:uncharacterized protein (DUF1919 family)
MSTTITRRIIRKGEYLIDNAYHSVYGVVLRKLLKQRDFSIISNNCYGGNFYKVLKTPYRTPTAGLYFMAEDYIRLLGNLKFYMDVELQFVEESRFDHLKGVDYPVGILNNEIEIHFLHYATKEEAYEKWERRKKRINWDKLFIMWNDQNLFREEMLQEFEQLPYQNKVFFSAKDRKGPSVIWIKYYKNKDHVQDMIKDRFKAWKYFNPVKWLNA